jgi:hypothetical protein
MAALVRARKIEALRCDQAPYTVCSQNVLDYLVRARPVSAATLADVPGTFVGTCPRLAALRSLRIELHFL